MLNWVLAFFAVALAAVVLGFGGLASTAAGIAQVLFYLFLIVFLVTLVIGLAQRGRVP